VFYITHIYSYAGKLYPSVTTIISNVLPVPDRLAAWKLSSGKDGIEKMKASQIVGTLAHYRILNKLSPSLLEPPSFSPDDLPPGALEKVDLCEIMWDELALNVGHPRKIERLLFNKEHGFCGTPDMVANIDDIWTLVDLKTSKEVYETHKLQMGGYYELLGCTPERAILVSIHPTTYNNKFLRAHTHEIPKEELELLRDRFLELAKEFHARDLTKKLAASHGIMGEEKQIIGCD
jgi:hypothetical protein